MNINKFYSSPFNSIIAGFALHAFGNLINGILGSQIVLAILCTIGWYFIIKGFVNIKKNFQLSGIEAIIYYLYVSICIVMIIRGYLIDYGYQWISLKGFINYHLFSPTYILPYIMPLIAYVPIRYYNFKSFISISTHFAFLTLFLFIIFAPKILSESIQIVAGFNGENGYGRQIAAFYICFGFSTLCMLYIKKKIWIINMIALLASLLIYLIGARRGSSLITACLLVYNIFVYINYTDGIKKYSLIIISIISLLIGIIIFNHSSAFSYIRQRGLEDSRSAVDEALLSQMSTSEKIFGKGLNGRYYFPVIEDDITNPWKGWRFGSETGYYNIVLKGGYLMAWCYILLLLIPALKGIFNSHNLLCKSGGFYIILSLLELYPFGWLSFNMKFLIIWMLIVLLNNQKIRNMKNQDIYYNFFK